MFGANLEGGEILISVKNIYPKKELNINIVRGRVNKF
jgi:hypothetical protein